MANRRITTNPSAVGELAQLFVHQLQYCRLQPGENCLVITDSAFNPIYSDACLSAAISLGAETCKLTLPYSTELPHRMLGAAMINADIIVYMTTHTLHYSEEMRSALQCGARALMAVQPIHALHRLKSDPEVRRRSIAGAELLAQGNIIQINSPAGTDLTLEKGSRPCLANYGAADVPGRLDFWGGGMTQVAVMEGSAHGKLVLNVGDCIFALGRYVESPVQITIQNGKIITIDGGLDAFLLRSHLASFQDENAWRIGHIAWGTDHRAIWTAAASQFPEPGISAADIESYYGNLQVEIGSNNDVAFQGKNATANHLGICMLDSYLSIDGQPIIQKGQFIPESLK